MIKAHGFSQVQFPYVFARQPYGIDLINISDATARTFVQARELTNGREAMFIVKRKDEDYKTLQVVYAEQFDKNQA